MSFSRTTRLIALDGFRGWLVRVLMVWTLILAWALWLFAARIRLYEVGEDARLEASASVHPVESPVSGRILKVGHGLGDRVPAGAVLFEIDPEHERHELDEARARLTNQTAQAEAIGHELATEDSLRGREGATAGEQVLEARARVREAVIAVDVARNEAERAARLQVHGFVSDMDLVRYRAEVEKRQAAVEALRAVAAKTEAEHGAQRTRSAARTAHLRHELTTTEGEIAALRARIRSLEGDVEERLVRAPVAGRVGRLADRHPGSVVERGDRLAEIVPDGRIRAVARFAPRALGRLSGGQRARLRLDAFPWTQFGVLEGRVERVASEAQDGWIRAELSLQPAPGSSIPVRHGLVGTAEVEVERVSPAVLALRAAGSVLGVRKPVSPSH